MCERPRCARWKGYYLRRMICAEMEYEGPIAIHVGHCKTQDRDFSLLPSFLLPRQQVSRLGLESFLELWKRHHCLQEARIEFAAGVGAGSDAADDGSLPEAPGYRLPRSTAYHWLYALIVRLRLHASRLAITPPELFSVFECRRLPLSTLVACLDVSLPWRVASALALIPP